MAPCALFSRVDSSVLSEYVKNLQCCYINDLFESQLSASGVGLGSKLGPSWLSSGSDCITIHRSAQMVNPGSSDSPQVKLMYELDSGFVKRDLDIIAKQLHKDYRHITHPRSLGMPEQTREEWLKHFAWVMSLWTENEVSYQFPLQFTNIG